MRRRRRIFINVWKKERFFRIIWNKMITMCVKSFTILGEKFVSNIGKMLNDFIRTNSKGFKFSGKVNRFEVFV